MNNDVAAAADGDALVTFFQLGDQSHMVHEVDIHEARDLYSVKPLFGKKNRR